MICKLKIINGTIQSHLQNKNTKSMKRLQRKTAAASFEILYRFKKQTNPEKGDNIADEPANVTQALLKSDESSSENCPEIARSDSEDIKKDCNNHKIRKTLEKEGICQEEFSKIEDDENQPLTSTLQSCPDENVENVVSTKKRRRSQDRPFQEEFSKIEVDENQSVTSTLQSYTDEIVENVVSTKRRRCSKDRSCQGELSENENDENKSLSSTLQSCTDENVENGNIDITKRRRHSQDSPCREELSKNEDNENQSLSSTLQSCADENIENVNTVTTKEGRCSQDRPCQEDVSKNDDYENQSLSSTLQSCTDENVENVVTTKKRRHSVIDISDIHQSDQFQKCQKVLNCKEEVASKMFLENADNGCNVESSDAKQTETTDSNVQV